METVGTLLRCAQETCLKMENDSRDALEAIKTEKFENEFETKWKIIHGDIPCPKSSKINYANQKVGEIFESLKVDMYKMASMYSIEYPTKVSYQFICEEAFALAKHETDLFFPDEKMKQSPKYKEMLEDERYKKWKQSMISVLDKYNAIFMSCNMQLKDL